MSLRCARWAFVLGTALPALGTAQRHVAVSAQGARDPRAAELFERRVTVAVSGVSLGRALDEIGARAKVRVLYRAEALAGYARPVSFRVTGATLRAAFDRALAGTRLVAVALTASSVGIVEDSGDVQPEQATGVVTGRVTDSANGRGLRGATLRVAGTTLSVVSRDDGRFTLRGVPTGEQVLTVRLFGYRPMARNVSVDSGGAAVDVRVALAAVATTLTDVVTTATGQQRRVAVGNDITTLNVDSVRAVAPLTSVTDLLESRVPGLVVQRSSGAPGAPARVRVRGAGSLSASNDPIIIVDGARVYSNQTGDRQNDNYSVLNSIDVNSIGTVEVLKGPSASSLYGSDAANGVIVITTKRGMAGKTRWAFSTDQQRTTQPGTFPDLYYRQGAITVGGTAAPCPLRNMSDQPQPAECSQATLIVFNPLRDARTTVLGTGWRQQYAASVSGGVPALQYFLSGQTSSDVGLLKMSDADVAYLERTTKASVPRWQRRPQSAGQVGGTARISMQVTPAFGVDFTTALNRTTRSTTPLDGALGAYQDGGVTPADTSLITGSIYAFRTRTTYAELASRHTLAASWVPATWWSARGDVGYNTNTRDDRTLLRRGDCDTSTMCGDRDKGRLSMNHAALGEGTVNLVGSAQLPARLGVRLVPSVGLNYVHSSSASGSYIADSLAPGAGGDAVGGFPGTASALVQLGLFTDVRVSVFGDRLSTAFGTRVDASNALGRQVRPAYPKVDLSYVLSDEPFFPWKERLNTLRLRMAYGHAAVQPTLGGTERTYLNVSRLSTDGPVLVLMQLGNPGLKPERSTELEGGFDLGVLNDRMTLDVTGYRKLSRDALVKSDAALSLGQYGYTANLGSVRNTGLELALSAVVLDRPALRWSVNGRYARNRNTLVTLDSSTLANNTGLTDGGPAITNRYVLGYPTDGVWLRPAVSYADVNGDGVISTDELVRSDSAVFVGGSLPDYDAAFGTQLGGWGGRVTLDAQFSYQNGMAKINSAMLQNNGTLRALNDPATSLAEQAAVRSGYAGVHTVSTLRFQTLSVRATLPAVLTRRFGASAASVALQGSNLWLHSTYSGSDPSVMASVRDTRDTGVLPQPRTWGLNVSLNY